MRKHGHHVCDIDRTESSLRSKTKAAQLCRRTPRRLGLPSQKAGDPFHNIPRAMNEEASLSAGDQGRQGQGRGDVGGTVFCGDTRNDRED